MRLFSIAVGLLVLGGCYTAPRARELPPGHPASAGPGDVAYEAPQSPFTATPTLLPPAPSRSASSMPGMDSHGMADHAGPQGVEAGEGTEPSGNAPEHEARYTCPMHPEVVRSAPGACPKCGMKLRPIDPHSHQKEDPHQ